VGCGRSEAKAERKHKKKDVRERKGMGGEERSE